MDQALLLLAQAYRPELILSLLCFLFLFHLINRHRCRPVDWPLLGMIPAAVANSARLHDWTADVLRRAGCTFVFKGPWSCSQVDVLLTCDPANVAHVFTANFKNYPKGEDFAEMFDVLGNGIFTADEASWAFQRRKAHLLLAEPRFRAFVAGSTRAKLERALLPLLERLAMEGRAVDLQDVFLRLTFDTTAAFVFGFDPGCLSPDFPTVPFARAIDDAEEVLFYRHLWPRLWLRLQARLGLGHHRKMARARAVIDQHITEYIARRREMISMHSKVGSEVSADLLTSYLNSQAEVGKDGADFDAFVRDTALNFMVAGRDTTSSALTWFFWLLSSHPDVENKILEELRRHAPKTPGFPSAAELKEFVYLHASLCESLRLYPPVPFERKAAAEHDTLPSGAAAHPKRRVMFSFYAMGRMEGIWGEDCLEFRPERWLTDAGKPRHEPSYKFPAFNLGPRTCLGRDLAFGQMKAVVAAVVAGFRVRPVDGFVARPKLSIILHMEGGLKVRVSRRETALHQ